MSDKQQAQARIAALQQQLRDAEDAEAAAAAALAAAQAAKEATDVAAGHLYGAIAGTVPVPATTVPTTPAPAPVAPATTPVPVTTTPATTPDPTQPLPATPAQAQRRRPRLLTPALWSLGEIIGLVVGLVVGLRARHWAVEDLARVHGGSIGADVSVVVATTFWLAITVAVGFYAGGYVMRAVRDRTRPNSPNP